MIVLTNAQMRAADAYTIEVLGTPALELMEKAGEALYLRAKSMLADVGGGDILVVCGGGNNGGDGFVCARRLQADGYPVTVAFVGKKCTEECSENLQRYISQGGSMLTEFPDGQYALVVDCIFGTGFTPRGNERELFEKVNDYRKEGATILSADVPSGLCDDGTTPCGCVVADGTICFGYQKIATCLENGLDESGVCESAPIGISLPSPKEAYVNLVTDKTVRGWLPVRKRNSHKGTYGRAAIVGGSRQYSGAAYLALSACVRGGAGYSSLYLPKELISAFYLKIPEALLVGCEENFVEGEYESLLQQDAIGFGVGATSGEKTKEILRFLLKNYTKKLVIDADGLNVLASLDDEEKTRLFKEKKCSVILTPHKKEFSRLTKKSVEEVTKNALDISKAYAKENGVTVLLKGAATIVTDGDRVYLNTRGQSGQAKGGSGDVLTGLLTSLLATGLPVLEGGAAAAYLAGRSAELCKTTMGEYALTASDVISHLGGAFLELQR